MSVPRIRWMVLIMAAIAAAGCGTVEPGSDEQLVVEAFATTGSTLPEVTLRHTSPLRSGGVEDAPAAPATVGMWLEGEEVPYAHENGGRYLPLSDAVPQAGQRLELQVDGGDAVLRGSTTLPPAIGIDSVRVEPAPVPIEAVLIDSLDLTPGIGVTGYLYLIDVHVFWRDAGARDSSYVRVQLLPDSRFASRVIDLFLRSDEVLQEDAATRPLPGVRQWSGVYAVRVDHPDAPLPGHALRVGLIRSGPDYARYALSREAVDRREPIGNIDGGLGIFAGIAIDSLRVRVGP